MLVTTKQKKTGLEASNQAVQPSIREETINVVCNTKYQGVQIDENQIVSTGYSCKNSLY